MDLGLSGRACAVTGASRGIGRGIAERLLHELFDLTTRDGTRGYARSRPKPSSV